MNGEAARIVQVVLAASLLIVMLVIGLWDIYAVFLGKPTDTVSSALRAWALAFPMLPFAIGALIGHIFWNSGPIR